MPAIDTPHVARTIDEDLAPWKSRIAEYFDQANVETDDVIWDDWGVVDALCRERDEQELILSGLVRLMELSISGYVEILEFAGDARLNRFAEVVVRQRAAQSEELRGMIERERSSDYFEHEVIELESLWRVAIWNLEQDRQSDFLEFANRAEALLEETLLTAAKAFRDEEWSRRMTDFAVSVCGARTVWEDFGEVEGHDFSGRAAVGVR